MAWVVGRGRGTWDVGVGKCRAREVVKKPKK